MRSDPGCLLIADDLTGACDAAVQFAMRGLAVRVSLSDNLREPIDVLAVSTESRDCGLASFRAALEPLLSLNPRILFKKIDSTLRGYAGAEVSATLDAFGYDFALVTPAFPAMGRIVESGYLLLQGEIGFVPLDLAACFPDRKSCFLLRDATCDADLDAIVRDGLALDGRVVWAGSAGLAAAVARAIAAGAPGELTFAPAPPMFCLGSDHPVTLEQQRRLMEARSGSTVLRIGRNEQPGRVREQIGDCRVPLVLSGGDTASLVCRALEVKAIDLRREVAPGIPCGILCGGPFHGLPVVTKSGGFGQPDALIEISDFFTCSPKSH